MAAYYYRPNMPVLLRPSQPHQQPPPQPQQQQQQQPHQQAQQPDVTHLLREISDQVADKVAERMRNQAAVQQQPQPQQLLQPQEQQQQQQQHWSASPYQPPGYQAAAVAVPQLTASASAYSNSGGGMVRGCQQLQQLPQQQGFYIQGYYPTYPMQLQQQQLPYQQYQQQQQYDYQMYPHYQYHQQPMQHHQQQQPMLFSTSYSTPICASGCYGADDARGDCPQSADVPQTPTMSCEIAAVAASAEEPATQTPHHQHQRQRHPTDPSKRQSHQHQHQHHHLQPHTFLTLDATPIADDSGVGGVDCSETDDVTATSQAFETPMTDCSEAAAQPQHQHQVLLQPAVPNVVPCWQYQQPQQAQQQQQQQPLPFPTAPAPAYDPNAAAAAAAAASAAHPRFAMYRVQSQRQASLWQQHQQLQYNQQYNQQYQPAVPGGRYQPVMYSSTAAPATALYVPLPTSGSSSSGSPYCIKAWGSMPSLAVASASPVLTVHQPSSQQQQQQQQPQHHVVG